MGPLAEAFAQAWDGSGWAPPRLSSTNQVGLTAAFRLTTSVLASGVDTLATASGMPSCGTYWLQLAGLSLTAAVTSSIQNATSLDVTGWPSDHFQGFILTVTVLFPLLHTGLFARLRFGSSTGWTPLTEK